MTDYPGDLLGVAGNYWKGQAEAARAERDEQERRATRYEKQYLRADADCVRSTAEREQLRTEVNDLRTELLDVRAALGRMEALADYNGELVSIAVRSIKGAQTECARLRAELEAIELRRALSTDLNLKCLECDAVELHRWQTSPDGDTTGWLCLVCGVCTSKAVAPDPECPMCEGQDPVEVAGVTQWCEGCCAEAVAPEDSDTWTAADHQVFATYDPDGPDGLSLDPAEPEGEQ